MKKLITILFLIILFNAFSQSPESFNYQAVIRNSSGDIISNQTIGMQFRILSGIASGNSTYQETFTIETSSNGLVALQIGSGSTVSGDFASIDWGNGPFFLETSIDLNGGNSFEVMGTSQLVSVPYALYAKSSGSSTPGPQGENGIDGKTILSGAIAPTSEGVDGDFYINTITSELYGPKTNSVWGAPTSLIGPAGSDGADGSNGVDGEDGQNGADGSDGNTVLSGTVVPTTEGVNGDFYINTATNEIYGPKTSDAWGSATSLIGTSGSDGADGNSGNTVLNGTVAPTTEGVDGDFYINTATSEIFGPKTSGSWGVATLLIGASGSNGTDGNDGNTVLSGTVAPTTEGVNGDFYINTSTNEIFGPKTADTWGSATSLAGANGSDGVNGNDGNTVLSGTVTPTTEGVDGDFYINTTTSEIFGPKTGGSWGSATSLIGDTGPQGPAGAGGGSAATYRWASFHTYSNSIGQWALNNDPNMFGGVAPSQWTDGSAIASQMSSDKEVLRTLFQRKGYAKKNAMIANDEFASFSSTNGRVTMALFRIKNNTSGVIQWSPNIAYSAYASWGEKASAALNGNTEMDEVTSGSRVLTLNIPPNRTSTFIVVSTSSIASGSTGMRLCRLAFIADSLELPAGLEFVDDLDTATGGWEQ